MDISWLQVLTLLIPTLHMATIAAAVWSQSDPAQDDPDARVIETICF